MKKYISFIDFTNMSDEEKYKLLNSKDYEIERLNNIINETKKILLLNFDTTTTIFNALNKLSEVDK